MTIFVVLGVRAVMRFRRQCSLSCCILFSRYWEQSLAIFPGDRLGDVARELGEPGLHGPVVIANDLPARRHPGVGADHEAVRVLHEDHPPLGIERAAVRDVGPERQPTQSFGNRSRSRPTPGAEADMPACAQRKRTFG